MPMRFTYRSGDRPLDGYTIKRGVGSGGFGEVYFALSDGGKQVALKFLKGHAEIELRGIDSTLNLKHANLVHVYDRLTDSDGNHWIVMEYVIGESLAQVIHRHPLGLPPNMVKEWFVSLTQAVGYLHDNGVVHRDLKPANIFVENGLVKVGDYGLCKSLHSVHKSQTEMVGTVHYMAPEIAGGNYGKGIDIYALGIILHEMLTGRLPFDGESHAEILAKHLMTPPDLNQVPPAFRSVLAKALEKNPVRRFQTALELRQAVEAAMLPLAAPVASPDAKLAAMPKPTPVPASPTTPASSLAETTALPHAEHAAPAAPAVPKADPALPLPQAKPVSEIPLRDWLTNVSGSMAKTPLVVALALLPFGVFMPSTAWEVGSKLFLVATLLSWAMLLGAGRAKYREDLWRRRLRFAGLGAGIGLFTFWLYGWTMPLPGSDRLPADLAYPTAVMKAAPEAVATGWRYMLYFAGVLGIGRWWRAAARDRKERFSLFPSIAAVFWGGLLMFLWPSQAGPIWAGVVPLVVAVLAVQMAAPWDLPKPPPSRKLRYRPA